ncbi:MAG: helix-turn-helix domain-containing protein [Synergistaceae bacterium]
MTRLQTLRWERNLTLQQLAELTGIAISTLSRSESLKRRVSGKSKFLLSKFYKMPVEELFDEMGYAKAISIRR